MANDRLKEIAAKGGKSSHGGGRRVGSLNKASRSTDKTLQYYFRCVIRGMRGEILFDSKTGVRPASLVYSFADTAPYREPLTLDDVAYRVRDITLKTLKVGIRLEITALPL